MSYDELKELFFSEKIDSTEEKKIANAYVIKAKKEKNETKLIRGYYYCSLISNDEQKINYFDSIINIKTPKTDKKFPLMAYYEKGIALENLFKFNKAINCYLQAEKIALERENIDYYYHCKFAVGILKSEKMGEVEEALTIFKEFHAFFDNKKNHLDFSISMKCHYLQWLMHINH